MKTESLKLETPLGVLLFSASSSDSAELSLDLCEPDLTLANGMVVQQRRACVMKCRCEDEMENLVFECRWESPFAKGSPETGECLDAQSWESDSHVVVVGTEDFDQLSHRLPNCGLSLESWPRFPDHGLIIKLPKVPKNSPVSLHFVVASNELPEPRESSCWFAVDMDHDKVLECLE